jgi:sulfatase modifying factor 1
MIEIPGGTFLMGSEVGADDEKPVHQVTLDTFLIGRFAVTNREYNEFAEPLYRDDPNFNDPMQPVVGVSWFEAFAYCKWLSDQTSHNYRLPTEAEWEFAARCGSPANIYPWGTRKWEEWPELHHRFKNGPERIGSFPPNSWAIHDMGMNVHEWCLDWYDAFYYRNSPETNPRGPQSGKRRASRGGSWRHAIKITRCAARSSIPPEMHYADYGFRLVQELD